MKKLVQFGAGNIGRSFIGQLFSRSGYEVVFVDIDRRLVDALNASRAYRVVVKRGAGRADEILDIQNVRAVRADDPEAVAREIADASIAAVSVGGRALGAVMTLLARGLELRRKAGWKPAPQAGWMPAPQAGWKPAPQAGWMPAPQAGWKPAPQEQPLDLIIAENLHGAADFCRDALGRALPADYPLERLVGLVETSIGKMVPIMRAEDLERDPLWVFAEPYNRLILDRRAFLNPIPEVEGLAPKENIRAWVDRKLFIHNLGHAASAYFGHQADPSFEYVYEALERAEALAAARRAMTQSAAALVAEYPADFTPEALKAHVDDLLERFRNRALGDTIFRVGRDLYRKLGRKDRLTGAMLLCQKHGLPFDAIARAYVAAIGFRARDEEGNPLSADVTFVEKESSRGIDSIATNVSGLDPGAETDRKVMEEILRVSLLR